MYKLDNNLLVELGLGALPVNEKNKMLGHIYDTLELRVGMRLAQQMSDEQLKEFETFVDSGNDADALKWLEENFPDYKSVVADELELLKAEIKSQAPEIMAATMNDSVQAQPPPPEPNQAP